VNSPSSPSLARIGTPQHFRWLHGIVKMVLVLNLVDALLTLVWVGSGLAREANPLLAELVEDRPVAFAVVKLTLVGLGSLLLWRLRYLPTAVVSIFIIFIAYYALLLWHVRFLGQLIAAWL
jgi:hypothetical protein